MRKERRQEGRDEAPAWSAARFPAASEVEQRLQHESPGGVAGSLPRSAGPWPLTA